jgi:hypothetical protein
MILLTNPFSREVYMNRTLMSAAQIAALLAAAAISHTAQAADAAPGKAREADKSYVTQVTDLKFYDNGGIDFARGFGDPAAAGQHSNYIRMAGNTASPLHTHTNEYYGVVIAGVVANEPAGSSKDRPLAAGSYWYQQGGQPHVTKCISATECLFFVTQVGAFDFHLTP